MTRLVIYDLDGTLVDTREDLRHADAYVRSRLDPSAGPPGAPAPVEAAEALFAAYYARHAYEHSRLYPGVRRLLAHFHGKCHQAVLTDRPNPFARELVETLGVSRYFLEVVAGGAHPGKPHPAGALALMAKAGARPEETLLIGDRPIDVETGRNAGAVTVAVAHGAAAAQELRACGPDVLADDLPHVLELARRSGW